MTILQRLRNERSDTEKAKMITISNFKVNFYLVINSK